MGEAADAFGAAASVSSGETLETHRHGALRARVALPKQNPFPHDCGPRLFGRDRLQTDMATDNDL